MTNYKKLNEEELRELLECSSLTETEKYDVLLELLERGLVVLDRMEWLH